MFDCKMVGWLNDLELFDCPTLIFDKKILFL